MALKATRLIRAALAQPATAPGIHRAKELLIEAREWAAAHHQPRLCATARHQLAAVSMIHQTDGSTIAQLLGSRPHAGGAWR